MACDFSLPFTVAANIIVDKARNAVTSQGGRFEGNDEEGSFYISMLGNTVSGSYKIIGNNLDIHIASKPMFVPCSTIEGFLKKQLS